MEPRACTIRESIDKVSKLMEVSDAVMISSSSTRAFPPKCLLDFYESYSFSSYVLSGG